MYMRAADIRSSWEYTDYLLSIVVQVFVRTPLREIQTTTIICWPKRAASAVMSGKSEVGKSCLLRRLIADLPPGLYRPVYLCHTTVAIMEFYTHLCSAFGIESCSRRSRIFRDLKDRITVLNHSDRVHPLLIIDEAQYLSNDILAELRMLTNFEVDSVNAITVLLCGSENPTRRFALSVLEPLANSVTITITLGSLEQEETPPHRFTKPTSVNRHRSRPNTPKRSFSVD